MSKHVLLASRHHRLASLKNTRLNQTFFCKGVWHNGCSSRSLTESSLSLLVEGFGTTNPLIVIPSAERGIFLRACFCSKKNHHPTRVGIEGEILYMLTKFLPRSCRRRQ